MNPQQPLWDGEQENLLVIDFGVERWIYPVVVGWGVKGKKAAGVYSQMGRSYWLKSRRRR